MATGPKPTKVEYTNIYLLRLLAILLIVNAHLGGIMPSKLLGSGGFLGNSLFYFVSGLGLSLSRNQQMSYVTWLKKRFFNLLLPIVILFAITELDPLTTLNTLYDLLIPHSMKQTGSFFVNLVILYLIFWPLQKLSSRSLGLVLGGLMVLPYLILALPGVRLAPGITPAQAFFPVSAAMNFVSGMLTARLLLRGHPQSPSLLRAGAGATLAVLCLGAHHTLNRSSVEGIQLLTMHVNLLTVLSLFLASQAVNRLPADSFVAVAAKGLSLLSLPVYAIHFKILREIRPMDLNPYLKVILIYVVSFILAKLFDVVYARIRDKGKQLLKLETA